MPTDTSTLSCDLILPSDFRAEDILAFHRRDAEEVAERVDGVRVAKGQVWDGQPALLELAFGDGRMHAALHVDGAPRSGSRDRLVAQVRRMIGLDQPVADFAAALADHPALGPLIARQPGLRVPQTATPFEALAWAVTGQQISVQAAVSVRRRFIRAFGMRHSSGLWCPPGPEQVAAAAPEALQGAGLSRTKARTLQTVSEQILSGELPLDQWLSDTPADTIQERLNAVRGIGPWTVSYALLRGYGWLDGSLDGDVAVRRNLQALLGRTDKPTQQETRDWLADFSPWRALVAAHLWAMQSAAGY